LSSGTRCAFSYNTLTPPGLAENKWRYVLSNMMFDTFCRHGKCNLRFPEVRHTWVVAIGCGLIKSKDQWEDLVQGSLNINKVCGNSNCREPTHLGIDRLGPGMLRPQCHAQGRCQCTNSSTCMVGCKATADICLSQLEAAMDQDLGGCPHPGCTWRNPFQDFTKSAKVQEHRLVPRGAPNVTSQLNRKPN